MANMLQDQPYKNREHVIAEIKRCAMASSVSSFLSFLFVLIGIIGDALNTTLGLTSLSWFLLAIVAGLNAIIGHNHVVVAKHLFGIEAESKKRVVNFSTILFFLVFIKCFVFYAFDIFAMPVFGFAGFVDSSGLEW